jgi:branched-chain amino acid transport system permease protein
MLIAGGMRSLSGAVIGAVFISMLSEFLRRIESGVDLGIARLAPHPGIQQLILALTLLLTLLLRPSGISGGRELGSPRWRSRRRPAGADTSHPLAVDRLHEQVDHCGTDHASIPSP